MRKKETKAVWVQSKWEDQIKTQDREKKALIFSNVLLLLFQL